MENPPFWLYSPGKMEIFMGYVSFREGMFFLNALGFLTKDLRGIECQNDVPNKGFQHHHPRLGVTKCWFCPWVFIDDGSRWACFRAQNTSILKYWNWFFVKFLTIKTSKHVHSYFHQSQTSQNCLVFLVFVLSDVCFVFYHGIHHHYKLGDLFPTTQQANPRLDWGL